MPKFKIGDDDFKKLVESGGYFVDKSLLIQELIEGSTVTLLPRPRRFGKTLNMTMLRYFFEKTDRDHSTLFDGLAITNHADLMEHQGKYPVVYMSLKDVRGADWTTARNKIIEKLAELYKNFSEVKSSLAPDDLESFDRLASRRGDQSEMELSLKKLLSHLHAHHRQPVVVLVDEYDSPIIDAWKNGYYDKMVNFMRSWLGGGLKHENAHVLYRAVITGILRVARESMFSGLNNLKVASMLQPGPFADKFGFTQPELDKILESFELTELSDTMQTWYNGYDFGGHVIYNPWSVINCIDSHPAPIGPQWLNTASNELVHAELEAGGLPLKRDLEKLLKNEELRHPITEDTIFEDIGNNPGNIWSFLYFSGYLRASDPRPHPRKQTETVYNLSIPNLEVAIVYEQFITRWQNKLSFTANEDFLDALLEARFHDVERYLNELVCNLISYHDVSRYPEAAYHAFVLGLLANLRQVYTIRSNPESGYGRADIIMQPKTDDYPLAFIIEFKSIPVDGDLETTSATALAQIEEKAYDVPLLEAGIKPEMIRKLAIVVSGKRVKVLEG